MTGELERPQKRPQWRPSTRPLTPAHARCAGEGDGQNGETGWTTPTTAAPLVAGTPRRSVAPRPPPPPQKSHLAGPVIVLPFSVAAACPKVCALRRCLRTHMQGPFPRVRLRADSHMPATQCCAARNPPPISSQRRLGAPAARQQGPPRQSFPLHDRIAAARPPMRRCL